MNASAEPEKQTQYKPNTKPIQTQSNPISTPKTSFHPQIKSLLIF